jgi:single-strand DNA-binding protein
VTIIGHLSREPELRNFANGGAVCNLGIAINRRRKNANGEWESYPVWLDCKAFNRGTFALATWISERCRKGDPLFITGELDMETWDDKNGGGKRSKLVIIVEQAEFLTKRDGEGQQRQQQSGSYDDGADAHIDTGLEPAAGNGDIPF